MSERFTPEQVNLLQAKLSREHVKTRQQAGRTLSYIEGYQAINEANRIFGFGNWSTFVTELTCIVNTGQGATNYQGREKPGYLVAYVARVKVMVEFEAGMQSHEDVGYGEGIEYSNVGQAHESAIKEAVTDAEKRALRHWGNVFGLALYDKDQKEVERLVSPAPARAPQQAQAPANARPMQTPSRAPVPPSQAKPKAGPERITDDQRRAMFRAAADRGWQENELRDAVLAVTGQGDSKSIPANKYAEIIRRIENPDADPFDDAPPEDTTEGQWAGIRDPEPVMGHPGDR